MSLIVDENKLRILLQNAFGEGCATPHPEASKKIERIIEECKKELDKLPIF